MSKKAWVLDDNFVQDVCQSGDPFECYHPDIAKLYTVDVLDDIKHGATLQGGVWVNLPPDPPFVPEHLKPAPAETPTV